MWMPFVTGGCDMAPLLGAPGGARKPGRLDSGGILH